MKKIIINVSGKDRIGIISDITKEISQLNGNIETSKMIKLGQEFNMLMLVTIDDCGLNNLKKKLSFYENLSVSLKTTKQNIDENNKNKFTFILKGSDNEGIVHSCTNIFHNFKINVIDLETKLLNAPITGSPLFCIKAIIYVSNLNSLEKFKGEIASLENDNNVVVKLIQNDGGGTNH